MIGKPVSAPTADAQNIDASLARLGNRLGELHEQLSYLEEALKPISVEVHDTSVDGVNTNPQAKSEVRETIDEFIGSVIIATDRTMRIRCNLDL